MINPWREGINTAIRADFWGYIAPADPRRRVPATHLSQAHRMTPPGNVWNLMVRMEEALVIARASCCSDLLCCSDLPYGMSLSACCVQIAPVLHP